MKLLLLGAALLAVGCTPGSFALASAGAAAGVTGKVVTVDVDLSKDPNGYLPQNTVLSVGDGVRFHNSDGFAHTATSIAGTTFPATYPFTNSALNQTGNKLSQGLATGGFSSGNLTPDAVSQTLLADEPGTYLFGCFYHYGTPMRARIDVQ
jgi:plastocyanin